MSNGTIDLQNVELIGENKHGYRFGIGKIGRTFVGFSVGALKDGGKFMSILPGCFGNFFEPETPQDEQRRQMILRVGAIAQSCEHCYGGISQWFVPEDLRGRPEDFECETCGSVGCAPGDHDFDEDDYF